MVALYLRLLHQADSLFHNATSSRYMVPAMGGALAENGSSTHSSCWHSPPATPSHAHATHAGWIACTLGYFKDLRGYTASHSEATTEKDWRT